MTTLSKVVLPIPDGSISVEICDAPGGMTVNVTLNVPAGVRIAPEEVARRVRGIIGKWMLQQQRAGGALSV